MSDDDPGFGQGKRPWFGPKRFGYGTRPQTWQGFLITGLCVAFIAVLAALTGGHSRWMILGVVPLGLIAIFGRNMGRGR